MKMSLSIRFLLNYILPKSIPLPSENRIHFIVTEENDLVHTEKQKAETSSELNIFSAINKNIHE